MFRSFTFIFLFSNKKSFILELRALWLLQGWVWNRSFRNENMCVFFHWVCCFFFYLLYFHNQQKDWQMEIPQKPPQNDMTDFPTHFTTTNLLWYMGIVIVPFYAATVSSVILPNIFFPAFTLAFLTPVSALRFVSVLHVQPLSSSPSMSLSTRSDSWQRVHWIVW